MADRVTGATKSIEEDLAALREELNTTNGRVKNLKSQLARLRNRDEARLAGLREQVAAGESRAEELRREILRREQYQIDEKDLRRAMGSFDEVWKAMGLHEQRAFLGHLVEKVGYDGRTGKVTVSFRSAGVKKLCQK